jgi:hypothetical protein
METWQALLTADYGQKCTIMIIMPLALLKVMLDTMLLSSVCFSFMQVRNV